MLRIGKILALMMLSKSAPSRISLIQNILANVAAVIAFALVIAMLASAFLLCAIYQVYKYMIIYGFEPITATLAAGMLLVVIIAALIYSVIGKINILKEMPGLYAEAENPVSVKVHNVAQSFIDGLMGRQDANNNKKTKVNKRGKL